MAEMRMLTRAERFAIRAGVGAAEAMVRSLPAGQRDWGVRELRIAEAAAQAALTRLPAAVQECETQRLVVTRNWNTPEPSYEVRVVSAKYGEIPVVRSEGEE